MADHRERALHFDATDPLAPYRDRVVIADPDQIYLDGNSLGRLPITTADRLHRAITDEWGQGLVRSWEHWFDTPHEVGDLLGTRLLGAEPGEVLMGETTSSNLYKLAAAALDARPDRHVVVTDDDNFPSDRYVLEGLAHARGLQLRMIRADLDEGVSPDDVRRAVDDDVALVSLSHVAFRSGALADMAAITSVVSDAGALMIWDLAHSVGAVPIDLHAAGAQLAVGCTYKYLCGGPGAPAFLYVARELQSQLRQPIWGWFGQRNQFEMGPAYDPVEDISRFAVSSPPILGAYAAEEGILLVADAGLDRLRAKAIGLTSYLIELADEWLTPLGFRLASPRDPARRGAHVTLHHPEAWQICQAVLDRGVVPDYRTPQRLRIGPAPLYTRFVDVYDAMSRIREVVAEKLHLTYPVEPARVT